MESSSTCQGVDVWLFLFVLSLLPLSYFFSFHFWRLPFLPLSPFLPNNEHFSRQFLYEENRAVISTVVGEIEKTK